MEKRGIFLIAFGKRGYAYCAYNLAFSIKFFNPEMKVALLHDGCIDAWLSDEQKEVFDVKIQLPDSVKLNNGKADPCKVKVSIYDFLPFENNLYIDVDSIATQDVTQIFDDLESEDGYYFSMIKGLHKLKDGRDIPAIEWAYADDIWKHFDLKEDAVLPGCNSSFQFIKKCDEAKLFFAQLKKNYSNPLPEDKLKNFWGGGQPDELYLDATMAQMGITGETKNQYVLLGDSTLVEPMYLVEQKYHILSLYGNREKIKQKFILYYDNSLIAKFRTIGKNHAYKFHYMRNDKHANVKRIVPTNNLTKTNSTLFTDAIFKINSSVQIDSSKLIQSYPDAIRGTVKVTNWLNCAMIDFKGKTYFAYRMESQPWCRRMKIGLCLLDSNYQPIQSTNVLPELHSDLKNFSVQGGLSFPKGFHVEDPRLFIHKDELYLSYTDGNQMLQAKIDPETLKASESFYINKPVTPLIEKSDLIEKNWTFFSYEGKLYSVYNTSPHIILEMNGKEWKEVYREDFEHNWKWGQLRGGTSPVRIGDKYISFFHSAMNIKHKGIPGRQWFMGAYLFEAKPPFKPIAISKEPLLAGEVVSQSIPRLSNRIFVVFPNGKIRKEKSWLVSFGNNDYQCRHIQVTDELLKENLIPVIKKELVEA